jgi:cyclic pyranopterin phosphate synthase
MPHEDMDWFPRGGILSFEEMRRLVALLVPLGVSRIRLRGGEPTLRRDFPELISVLGVLPGVEELNMTTNGVRLRKLAPALREAGLQGVTISLDTLRADRFEKLTRRDRLDEVLDGIAAARKAGFPRLKVNCVTVKGENDDEALDFARFARAEALSVRFIEWMPLDGGGGWGPERIVPGATVKAAIEAVFPLEARKERPEAPARPYRFADGSPGEVGFINPMTEPFCAHCDRLRLTADGKLKNCMFDAEEVDVMGPLRGGATDEELLDLFAASVAAKSRGGLVELKPAKDYAGLRNMSRLGG